MNGEIRNYPAKEMSALDMAEALRCAFIGSFVAHGCEVTITDGTLYISGGRIMLGGRICYVPTGNNAVELPSDVGSLSDGTVCSLVAVCNLSSVDNPFYVTIVSPSTLSSLQADQSAQTDDLFNPGNGVRLLVLGTVKVHPSTGIVDTWTASTAYSPRSNTVIKNELQSALNTLNSTVSSNYTTLNNRITSNYNTLNTKFSTYATLVQHNAVYSILNAWTTYLKKISWSDSKIRQQVIHTPSWSIAAGKVVTVSCPAIYNATVTRTGNNARRENIPSVDTFSQTYTSITYNGATVKVPLNVDTAHWTCCGLSGVGITNADVGGKNKDNCLIAGFLVKGSDLNVRAYALIKNTGTAAALIDVDFYINFIRAQ